MLPQEIKVLLAKRCMPLTFGYTGNDVERFKTAQDFVCTVAGLSIVFGHDARRLVLQEAFTTAHIESKAMVTAMFHDAIKASCWHAYKRYRVRYMDPATMIKFQCDAGFDRLIPRKHHCLVVKHVAETQNGHMLRVVFANAELSSYVLWKATHTREEMRACCSHYLHLTSDEFLFELARICAKPQNTRFRELFDCYQPLENLKVAELVFFSAIFWLFGEDVELTTDDVQQVNAHMMPHHLEAIQHEMPHKLLTACLWVRYEKPLWPVRFKNVEHPLHVVLKGLDNAPYHELLRAIADEQQVLLMHVSNKYFDIYAQTNEEMTNELFDMFANPDRSAVPIRVQELVSAIGPNKLRIGTSGTGWCVYQRIVFADSALGQVPDFHACEPIAM